MCYSSEYIDLTGSAIPNAESNEDILKNIKFADEIIENAQQANYEYPENYATGEAHMRYMHRKSKN